ncbi:MAG: flavodoxin domain-containing protein [Candidatus Omnitrophica bacterium]|nr:flavodoxin domain-containing protein [Candidatus Omnitrophota bacterium]
MKTQLIKKDIYWTGVIDWSVRNFHGHTYTTGRGTTYNSYLILDERIALVDTVYGPFASELIENIRAVCDPARIDYIIANHVETDHSGALPAVLKLCPKAKVVGTQKCREGLYKHYYCDMDFQVVKTGDTINLGKKTLTFIEAPMIHWPDSMFTYCPEEKLLMPNDAFGQHYADAKRFDDEVPEGILMDEAVKYYANILWPLGALILKKIEELRKMDLYIDMIAPSHGIIWRRDPGKIVNAYVSWAKQETIPRVVVVYETMWGATERMARLMVKGLMDAGVDAGLFDVNRADRTEIVKEMLGAKAFMFGSSTHDNDMLPNIAGFLEALKGLKPKNRMACAFGSFGWGGGAVSNIENIIAGSGIEISQPAFACKYMPDKEETVRCYEFGRAFGEKVLSG